MKRNMKPLLVRAAHRLIPARRTAMTLLVSLLTIMAWADEGYNYIGANGQLRNTYTDDNVPDASITLLTGSEESKTIYQNEGQDGWYVVTGKVTYSAGLYIEGHNDNVNLILCDGAEMSLSGYEYAFHVSGYHFNIYGQANGTGKVVTTNSEYGIYASVCSGDGHSSTLPGSFTIYGGTIEATGDEEGLNFSGGDFNINGGSVKATGTYYGINASWYQLIINGGGVETIGTHKAIDTYDEDCGIGIYADKGAVIINGGCVKAQGTRSGINAGDNGSVAINGGSVTVTGDKYGISAYTEYKEGGTVEIKGGTVTATGDNIGIFAYSKITISGGTVTATSGSEGIGIMNYEEEIKISGGNIIAIGEYGICAGDGIVKLGWTNTSDYITAKGSTRSIDGYYVRIIEGQTMTDGTYLYTSETPSETYYNLKDVTLRPLVENYTLTAKKATINAGMADESTNYWTTFYCGDAGYVIDNSVEACAYTVTLSGSDIMLSKLGKSIPAKTAVVIIANSSDETVNTVNVTMTKSELSEFTGSNALRGLDMATSRTSLLSTYGADAILMLSNKNGHFGFHDVALTNIPAHKAFLPINDSPSAREFSIVFEGATGIDEMETGRIEELKSDGAWYSLDGRRLVGQPTTKGVYVKNGKKVIIK